MSTQRGGDTRTMPVPAQDPSHTAPLCRREARQTRAEKSTQNHPLSSEGMRVGRRLGSPCPTLSPERSRRTGARCSPRDGSSHFTAGAFAA